MRTLVVEDEQEIATLLKHSLEEKAHVVDVAENSLQAYNWAQEATYDLIILEARSPKIDGMELCRQLRHEGKQTHILMLTANGAVDDRVNGLDMGADDCLSKPFAFSELLARVHALNRRNVDQRRNVVLQVADLSLNLYTYKAQRGEQEITLSAKEFALLKLFIRYPNQVFSREMILKQLWHNHRWHRSNVVDVFVSYLRRKIDDPFEVKLIQTVRGLGYRLSTPNVPTGKRSLR